MSLKDDMRSLATRRSMIRGAAALGGLGIGGALPGVRAALACHTYVSAVDGATGCAAQSRDSTNGTSGSSASSSSSGSGSSSSSSSSSSGASAGGSLRSASQPVLACLNGYGLTGAHAGLASAGDILTKIAFIPAGQHTVAVNGKACFDHSDKGIETGAQQVAKLISSSGTRFGIFDVEQYTSVNVPSAAGYSASKDGDLAARYDSLARDGLRKEAARYHTKLVGRVKQLLSSKGVELGEYNIPKTLSWYHRGNTSVESGITGNESRELGPGLLPLLSFTGPQAQLLIDQRMSDGIKNGSITDQMLIDWHAESVRIRKKALGSSARIMPVIWPRYFALGGARYPNGSAALKSDFMRRLCNAMLDAGAQGFVCWTPSSDNSLSSGDKAAMSKSWGEVVQVARSRGFKKVS